ncbi:hypothetical protein GGI42DRAFT_353042 [Trichoderma sp. SZMC 28013]
MPWQYPQQAANPPSSFASRGIAGRQTYHYHGIASQCVAAPARQRVKTNTGSIWEMAQLRSTGHCKSSHGTTAPTISATHLSAYYRISTSQQ